MSAIEDESIRAATRARHNQPAAKEKDLDFGMPTLHGMFIYLSLYYTGKTNKSYLAIHRFSNTFRLDEDIH